MAWPASPLPWWVASHARLAEGQTVPALVLSVQLTVIAWLRPQTQLTEPVHGISALPVKVTLVGQLTDLLELALSMVKVAESLLPRWLADREWVVEGVGVAALVLLL